MLFTKIQCYEEYSCFMSTYETQYDFDPYQKDATQDKDLDDRRTDTMSAGLPAVKILKIRNKRK